MFERLKNKGKSLKEDADFLKSDYDIAFYKGYLKGLEEAEYYIINGKNKWEVPNK